MSFFIEFKELCYDAGNGIKSYGHSSELKPSTKLSCSPAPSLKTNDAARGKLSNIIHVIELAIANTLSRFLVNNKLAGGKKCRNRVRTYTAALCKPLDPASLCRCLEPCRLWQPGLFRVLFHAFKRGVVSKKTGEFFEGGNYVPFPYTIAKLVVLIVKLLSSVLGNLNAKLCESGYECGRALYSH